MLGLSRTTRQDKKWKNKNLGEELKLNFMTNTSENKEQTSLFERKLSKNHRTFHHFYVLTVHSLLSLSALHVLCIAIAIIIVV